MQAIRMKTSLLTKRGLLMTLVTSLIASGAAAAGGIKLDSGALTTGSSYGEARETLIDSGWLPAGTCEGDAFVCSPAYPELESCAGTGTAPCRFRWAAPEGADGPKIIAVITEGEMGRVVTGLLADPTE